MSLARRMRRMKRQNNAGQQQMPTRGAMRSGKGGGLQQMQGSPQRQMQGALADALMQEGSPRKMASGKGGGLSQMAQSMPQQGQMKKGRRSGKSGKGGMF